MERLLPRLVYNLQAIQQNPAPYKQGQTALKMQTRVICFLAVPTRRFAHVAGWKSYTSWPRYRGCFPDKTGYAVGSIEGRCSIAHIEDTSKNFAFKHLGQQEVGNFPLRCIMQLALW